MTPYRQSCRASSENRRRNVGGSSHVTRQSKKTSDRRPSPGSIRSLFCLSMTKSLVLSKEHAPLPDQPTNPCAGRVSFSSKRVRLCPKAEFRDRSNLAENHQAAAVSHRTNS